MYRWILALFGSIAILFAALLDNPRNVLVTDSDPLPLQLAGGSGGETGGGGGGGGSAPKGTRG